MKFRGPVTFVAMISQLSCLITNDNFMQNCCGCLSYLRFNYVNLIIQQICGKMKNIWIKHLYLGRRKIYKNVIISIFLHSSHIYHKKLFI